MELRIVWALPAVFLAAGLAAEPPQMRLKSLTGHQRLGTVVEVVDGEAVYESDIHATVWAAAGGAFFYQGEGDMLRVASIPGKGLVEIAWAGTRLHLIDGGRVALREGGTVEVEAAGVGLADGSELSVGETLTVGLAGRRGGGLRPGDSLSLNVPEKSAFSLAAVEPVAEPTFTPVEVAAAPMPEVSTPVRRPKALTSKRAAPLTVARTFRTRPEPLSAPEQEEMRMAVGQTPAVPFGAVKPSAPPVRFLVEGVPPAGVRVQKEDPQRPGRLTRSQWGLVALITATAAMVGLEAWRRQDD